MATGLFGNIRQALMTLSIFSRAWRGITPFHLHPFILYDHNCLVVNTAVLSFCVVTLCIHGLAAALASLEYQGMTLMLYHIGAAFLS
jgi:hypothetical protein